MTVTLTAAPDSDPVALAARAIERLLGPAGLPAGEVPLVVLGCADPGRWPGLDRPLLDGFFAADVVRRVLLANGLVAAVPLGLSSADGEEPAVAEVAAAVLAAEGLTCVLAVALSVRGGALTATASVLYGPATGPRRPGSP